MKIFLSTPNRALNTLLAPIIFWYYFFTFGGIYKIRQIGDLLMFTIQSHLLYFFVSLGMYNYFRLEDYVPTISLMFLTVNVILQYYLGYKFRRIYKVLVDDEFSKESNNVPILRAVGYAVDRVFLNFIYFILFIFSTIGAISSLIEGHPFGLVLVLSSIVFFLLLRRSVLKGDLNGAEYEKDVERHYQLVKHLKDAATLLEPFTK